MAMKLGNLLVREGVITPQQLEEAVRIQGIYGGRLGTNLVELGVIDVDVLSQWLGRITGFPHATAAMMDECIPETLKLIPADMAERYECFPLRRENRRLLMAMVNPSDLAAADALTFKTGLRIAPYAVAETGLYNFLEKRYGIVQKLHYIRLSTKPVGPPGGLPAHIKREAPPPPAALAPVADLVPESNEAATPQWTFPATHEPKTLPGPPSLPPASALAAKTPPGHSGPASMAPRPKLPPAPYMAALFQAEPTLPPDQAAGLLTAASGHAPPAPRASAAFPRLVPPPSPPSANATTPRAGGPVAPSPAPPPAATVWSAPPPAPPPRAPPPSTGTPAPAVRTLPIMSPVPAGAASFAPAPAPASAAPSAMRMATMPEWSRPTEFLRQSAAPPGAPAASTLPRAPIPEVTVPPAAVTAPPGTSGIQPAPALRPPEVTLPPAPKALTQAQAVTALAVAKSREEIAEIILGFAGVVFDNALIFFVQEGAALGWKGRGVSLDEVAVDLIKVPLNMPSIFQEAHEKLQAAGGPITDTPFNRQLFKIMRRPPAKSVAVVPVVIRNRVVNLIYVDRLGRLDALEASAALSELAITVAEAYVRILKESRKKT